MGTVKDLGEVRSRGERIKRAGKPMDWHSLLTYTKQNEIQRTTGNLVTILVNDERWTNVIAYDERAESVVFTSKPPCFDEKHTMTDLPADVHDDDDVWIACWFEKHWQLAVSPKNVHPVVNAVAKRNTYDEVRTYLDALAWDGVQRVETWLSTYLGCDDTEYTRAIGAKWLISAVNRTYEPGCQADYMLILEGEQGVKKSSALQALVPNDRLFTDNIGTPGTKDAQQDLRGLWIVEFGELDRMNRAEVNAMKAFVTTKVDRYRSSYAKRTVRHPRRCVFAGSTNNHAYLRDHTGNRRFWPVRCRFARLEDLQRDRDQLWAEAKHLYVSGERGYLTDSTEALARDEQEKRYEPDPWEELIGKHLSDPSRQARGVSSNEVLEQALQLSKAHLTDGDAKRVAKCFQRLGWERRQRRIGEARVWLYFPNERVTSAGDIEG